MEDNRLILEHLGTDENESGLIDDVMNIRIVEDLEYIGDMHDRYIYTLGLLGKYLRNDGSSLEDFVLKTDLDGFVNHINRVVTLKQLVGKMVSYLDSEVESLVLLTKDYYKINKLDKEENE